MRQLSTFVVATVLFAAGVASSSAQDSPQSPNITRTTLYNPGPQYTWNGGGPPPASTTMTRGVQTTVTGAVAWNPNRLNDVPTYAQAVVRRNGYYWYSGAYYLTGYRVVSSGSFGSDPVNGADFNIPFTISTQYPAGTTDFFVEYYDANGQYVGRYNSLFSGGTAGTATPTGPSLHNYLTIYLY